MYRDFRDHNTVFEDVAARFPTALNLSYNNRSERIQAELVSGTWFDTLGLTTSLGRGLTVADDLLPGAHPVVVLTYDYWKSRFNGNSGILNQTVLLNGHPMTVVGVTAPGYHGFDPGARVDALVPTMMKAEMTPTWNGLSDRRVLWLQLVGRLRAGVSPRQAQASLEPYYHGLLIMEMQTMKFRTERSRSGFATKPLIFVPAGKGISDLREAVLQSAADPPRHRRTLAAHCLRERGQPAPGARRRQAEGDRDPPGRGRQPVLAGAPVDCGKPGPLSRRRRHRNSLRMVDRRRPPQPAAGFRGPSAHRHSRLTRVCLHLRAFSSHGRAVRTGSRLAGHFTEARPHLEGPRR